MGATTVRIVTKRLRSKMMQLVTKMKRTTMLRRKQRASSTSLECATR